MRTGKRWLAGLLCLAMLAAACSALAAGKGEPCINPTCGLEGCYTVTFYGRNGGKVLYTWQTGADGKLNRALPHTTRKGYHFMGWYTHPYEGRKITEKTVFKRDTPVWAHWARIEGRDVKEPGVYTVVFREDDNARTLPSAFQTGEDGKLPEIPEPSYEKRKGRTFLGWKNRATGEMITGDSVFTGDAEAVALWGAASKVTLIYISDSALAGRREYTPGTWAASLMKAPEEDRLKKRDFLGWFTEPEGGEQASALRMTENTTLYAHWSEPGWLVTFHGAYALTEDGRFLDGNRVRTDEAGKLSAAYGGVTRGARFDGWYLDRNCTEPLTEDTVFTKNTKVWARTEKTGSVKVRLDVKKYGSGRSRSVPEVLLALPGQPVGTLPQPEWTGDGSERRTFLGWFDENDNPVTAASAFTEETTIYAKWAEGYRITFAGSGDPAFRAAYTDGSGRLAEIPAARKQVRGNPALGWYTAEGEPVTAETVFGADTEVVPKWGYRILFHTEKAGVQSAKTADLMTDASGKLPCLPSATHPKGYPFAGWVDEAGEPVTAETVFTADTKVYGTWETGGVKLIFSAGRGAAPDAKFMMTRDNGSVDALPEAHHQKGLPFLGWSTTEDGKNPVTAETVFTAPVTKLYAIWEPVYKITFRPGEGRVIGGTKAIQTDAEGYVAEWPGAEHPLKLPFEGWYLSPRIKATTETKFTRDTWVDAKWGTPERRAGGYTLTLDDRGDTRQMQTADTGRVSGLPTPARADAFFYGWYSGPAATGMRLRNDQWIGGDMTVYAAWLIPLTEEEDKAQ